MLPYCLSPKHAPDTLFILTEEDWRLCAEDCRPLEDTDVYKKYADAMQDAVNDAGQASSSTSAEPIAARAASLWEYPPLPEADYGVSDDDAAEPIAAATAASESDPESVEPFATDTEPQTWLRRVLKPKSAEVSFPQSLKDVVRMCTCAHRCGHGDFVWLCWGGKVSGRSLHPSHGSTSIAITQTGALLLLKMMRAEKAPMHLDVLIRNKLVEDWWQGELRACYVCKTVGGFFEHESNSEEGYVRPANFDTTWTQEGTRGGEARTLRRFQKKGIHEICKMNEHKWLNSDYGLWKTLKATADWDPDAAKRIARYEPGLKTAIEAAEPMKKMSRRAQRSMRSFLHAASYRHWTVDEEQAESCTNIFVPFFVIPFGPKRAGGPPLPMFHKFF